MTETATLIDRAAERPNDEPDPAVPHLPKQRKQPAVVVAFGNQKGGVGKTATCASVASALARDFAVLAIDLDHQSQLGQDLDVEPDMGAPTVGEWMIGRADADPRGFIYETPFAVDVIPSISRSLSEATNAIRTDELDGITRLASRIGKIRDEYDFIVIDFPAGLDTLTNVGLVATDIVMPVVTPDYAAWLSCNRFIERVQQVQSSRNPRLMLGPIVRNMYNTTSNPPEQQRTVDESIVESGFEVWPLVIPRSEYISKARGYQAPAERIFAKQVSVHRYRALANFLSDWCALKGI